MRLFNFSLAVTLFSAATPVVNASLGDIRLPPETIPEKCRPTIQLAYKEGVMFDKWLKNHVCRDYKVSFAHVTPYIDRVAARYLNYIWARVNPPLDLHRDVWPFYRELKQECIMNPKWGVVDNPNFCDIKSGDEKLTNMVNTCIIPKVAAKYIIKVPEFGDWAKDNCQKGEPVVRDILVNTRCKQQHPSFVVNIFRAGCPKVSLIILTCFNS